MNFDTSMPIYLQIIHLLKKKLIKGEIEPGSKMPSTRNLAHHYTINPNTAGRIYKEMEREGLCFTKRGLGTFATDSKDKIEAIKQEIAAELIHNFTLGMNELGYSKSDMITIIKESEEL